ncbi:MAG: hypothetical protein AAGF01_07810 [Cyanobacteria bacterium P01_G01_bin.38]
MKTAWGKLVKYIAIAFLAICCFCLSSEPAMAQEWGTVDFSQVTFNSLPAFEEPGSIASSRIFADPAIDLGYDTAREWLAGDLPVDVLKLGDFQSSIAAQYLNLDQISQLTGIPLENLAIADIPFFEGMSLSDFISGVPALGGFNLDEVPGIAGVLGGNPGETISDILTNTPELGDLNVSEVFGEVGISEIPNLELAELDFFKGWENANISDIPGLGDVELGAISDVMSAFSGVTGMHDVTYGPKEHRVTPTKFSITGGDQVGFSVQCGQEPGCMYVELEGPGKMHGAQWIAGGKDEGQQMVEGGFGILGVVNGGEEPTGRHPFGDVFKVVLEQTNEPEGTAKYALYFNVCAKFFFVKTCTPYFLGPVPMPLLNSNEKGMVITGLLDGEGGASSGLEPPSQWENLRPDLPDDLKSILAANNRRVGGGGGAQVVMDEDCLNGILSEVPAGQRQGASETIPRIVAAAQEEGITDRAQIAYMLATMEREVGGIFNWQPVEEGGTPCSYDGGCGWHGRGYVQLTHRYNYVNMGNRLGIDLVGNPNLALDPDIAARILVIGMRDGDFNGYGHGLSHYVNEQSQDWYQARRTVNVLDHAGEIATNAQEYYAMISKCETLETTRGTVGELVAPIQELRTGTLGTGAQEYGAARPHRGCYGECHAGQDFDITQGVDDNFQSFIGGTVTRIGYDPGGYGHYADIYNAELGVVERIAEGSQLTVQVGDTVAPGQVISTGESNTGVIHYEIREPINDQGQGGFGMAGTQHPIEYLEGIGVIQREGTRVIPLINDQIAGGQ